MCIVSLAPFVVWAPLPTSVALMIRPAGGSKATRVAMKRDDGGWWHPAEPLPDSAGGEFDYGYQLDGDEKVLPDPRSRRQPDGVHGWSRSYDPAAYTWTDQMWHGRQLAGGIIYELHVGTFTVEGTLAAAIERLDHLVELGVDFVELMPVNGFNGPHNWGYDGVLWYAVHEAYGGPAAYQQFVDACHVRGLAVIQDVVYNHLGPSGNYLPRYGPYLNEGGANTWGWSPNLDSEDSDEVRRYIIDNAMMWLNDYHVDGLRLDAVHALHDTRATHVLEELAIETEALSTFLGRPLPLIAESDLNDPRLITTREGGGYGLTGQWSDDFHHALYVSLQATPAATTPTSTRWRRWARCSRTGSSTPGRGRPSGAGPTGTRSTPCVRQPGAWSCARTTTTRSATAQTAAGFPAGSAPTSCRSPCW